MARQDARGRLLSAVTVLALALAGCAEAPRPSAPARPTAATTAATEGAAALERTLREVLVRQAWSDLRIDTECQTEGGFRAATVFNSGVGIWNRERQFALPRGRVLALLREFESARFARMRETYGEGRPKDMALELICRVRLELDGTAKQVHQLTRGPWSPELKQLAERILAAAEEAGRAGPGASSLTDGLEKIARGALAPELLVLSVLRQGEGRGAAEGWELMLEGGKALLQSNPLPDSEEPRAARLAPGAAAAIAGQLAAAHLEELPVNLWAPEYTDLEVRVLNHRRSLQARQFAGMTPTTHGELQQRFDRLWEAIEGLRGELSAPSP